MAKLTLAQVAYLSQELSDHFKKVKHSVFKASMELEMARTTMDDLLTHYGQWIHEENIGDERK